MASEINVSGSMTAAKNGANVNGATNVLADMIGNPMIENVQIIGTDPEPVVLGDVASPAYVFLKNLDPTNIIEISLDNADAQKICPLKPGQFAMFPPAAALYAKALVAPANLLVVAA